MSRLNAAERKAIPTGQFAGPDRSFPIPDVNHARAALSMARYASDPDEIRQKVLARYPQIDAKKKMTRQALLSKMQGR